MNKYLNRSFTPEILTINPDSFGIDSLIPIQDKFTNGIPYFQINKGTQDVVKIEFLFNAGSCYQDIPFSAFSTIQLLTEGTTNYTAEKIADTLDFFGAYIEKEITRDFASITIYCLNIYLDKILPVVEEIIKSPVFPENELSIFKEKQKSQLTINNQKVNFLARTKFTELIYGAKHPYGQKAELEDIDNIENKHLIDFHRQYFRSNNCNILISGKIKDETILLLANYFGNQSWGDFLVPNSTAKDMNITKAVQFKNFIEKEDAVQSAVRIGRLMFTMQDADFHKFEILNTVLGGYFGSRLMKNIREDKGFTYGIGSGILPLKHSGYFFITTEVGQEYTNQTLIEIYKEIKSLREELIEEEELSLVKAYKMGEFMRSIDGPFATADLVKTMIQYDVTIDHYKNYLKTIQTITPEDIQKLANKYLQDNNLYELVVGKK
ncbi:MAG: M16 family metallopeptidase [Bacteroidales bacterium]